MERVSEIRLFALCEQIRRHLASFQPANVWVRAEINGIKETSAGHCYLDLIDKPSAQEPLCAQARAVIWNRTWRMLRPFFESVTGQPLAAGMQVLLRVQVQYSELYGVSLVVSDLDPTCTVGQEELLRQRTLARLKQEGMLEMNATLPFPRLPRRLAVISSEKAAGYLDFVRHLSDNDYGFHFHWQLYPALMQGVEAPPSIISALEQVDRDHQQSLERGQPGYDLVLLLRGGGSATDLRCFDDYDLCVNVAQFPLPVMTAIGHEQDLHLVDRVAAVHVKTPTALAHYLIEMLVQEDAMIQSLATRLEMAVRNKIHAARSVLERMEQRMETVARVRISAERSCLELLNHRLERGNPMYLLEQGYALAIHQGRRLRQAETLSPGDLVDLLLGKGVAHCQVLDVEQIKK